MMGEGMSMQGVELLAPAGSAAALHAAVGAGADAVYLGLESFNARRGADNFTLETLSEACDYAHLRGVKVYVAMNTVVLPGEMDEALELARQAYRVGADSFIVQDIGLAAELTRVLPDASLHVSTQMNVHNEAGVRAAARLGAERVTLARELSLDEVAELAAVASDWGMEVEVFAHGALCVCYSGQCLMSSMIGGRSANRGTCAQACRLPYELRNAALRKELSAPGDYLLSPQDLCTVDMLPDLIRAGVASLKIEGRMKSPEYVSAVVSVYRAVLDRVLNGDEEAKATEEEHRQLAEAFSRGFTTAYLHGNRGNDMMGYQRPNNRGVFVGRVVDVKNEAAYVDAGLKLEEGDAVEFWTKKGRSALVVSGLAVDRRGRVRIPLDPKTRGVRAGDRVFRVRSAAAVFDDRPLEPKVGVVGRAVLREGAPLKIEFSLADARRGQGAYFGEACGDVVEAARTKAVSADDVRAHVDRLGSTPFFLADFEVVLDEGVGVGFSQLHRVRASALEDLEDSILSGKRRRSLPRAVDREPLGESRAKGCRVVALATNPVCARAAKRAGAQTVFVPALNYRRGEAVVKGQLTGTAEQAGYPKQCVPVMPVADHDAVGHAREAFVDFDPWRYAEFGKPVMVESLGGMQRAGEMDAPFEVGPHVPVVNRLALETAFDFGAARVWLSPELTLEQIKDLAKDSPVDLGVTVIGTQELMITEHCILMSQGPCSQECSACPRRKSPHFLKDRKGFEFPVVTDAFGRSRLYNSVELDVANLLPELLAAGISSFMVDTTMMNGEETANAVGRAVRALRVAQSDGNAVAKVSGATSGHLFRGVS